MQWFGYICNKEDSFYHNKTPPLVRERHGTYYDSSFPAFMRAK